METGFTLVRSGAKWQHERAFSLMPSAFQWRQWFSASHGTVRRSFLAGALLWVTVVFSAPAMITSLYVFGDGVSTTTNNTNPSVAYLYYGHRFCNGRVWV